MNSDDLKRLYAGFCFSVYIIFATAAPLDAQIYKFVDEKGVLHFTNRPTSPKYKPYIWGRVRKYPRLTAKRYFRSHSPDRYNSLIRKASRKHGVDATLLKAIIKVESDFNPRAVSRAGARGLMQIMPKNFNALRITDPFDPTQNIMGGTRYFKQLLERFNGNTRFALAAYNAGPTSVDRFKHIPPFRETREYVRKVMKYYSYFKMR